MKPIKLIMSGYGPYRGVVEVPFDRLGDSGLFLITGDTGAGKTTIFDAITYALYGEVSGNTRPVGSLRSDFADAGTDTYVDLTFTHKGEIYRVHRNPEYDRPKKSGEGTTKQAADAWMNMPSGKVVTKVGAVNNAVNELIGVDHKQWSQIAMLAQGEFLRLLNADSKQRGEIFRKIFNTAPYVEIQKILGEKFSEVKRELESGERSIIQSMGDISFRKDDPDHITIALRLSESNIHNLEEVELLLERLIAEDENSEKEIKDNIKAHEKRISLLTGKIELATQINNLFDLLTKKEEELKALTSRTEEISIKQQRLDLSAQAIQIVSPKIERYKKAVNEYNKLQEDRKNLYTTFSALLEERDLKEKEYKVALTRMPETESINSEIVKLQELLPIYEKTEILRFKIKKLAGEQDRAIASISNLNERLKALQEERTVLAESPVKLSHCKVELANHYGLLERAFEKATALVILNKKIKEYGAAEKSCKTEEEFYLDIEENALKAQLKYGEMERTYFREQAGILAVQLKEGQPCPVCGSKEHPEKAKLSDRACSKEELDSKKRESDKLHKQQTEASGSLGIRRNTLGNLRTQIVDEYSKLGTWKLEPDYSDIILLGEMTAKDLEVAENKSKELKQIVETLQANIKEFEENVQIMAALEKEKAALETNLGEQKSGLEEITGTLREQQATIAVLSKDLGDKTKRQISDEIVEKTAIRDNIIENIQKCTSHLNDAKISFEKTSAVLEDMDKRLPLQKTAMEEGHKDYIVALALCKFKDEREYLEARLSEEIIEALGTEVEKYKEETGAVKAAIAQLKEQVEGKTRQDIAELGAGLEAANSEKNSLSSLEKIVFSRRLNNSNVQEKMTKSKANYENLKKKYMMVKELSDTAGGNLPGRQKIAFEHYVQAAYFELIIAHANKRLVLMTGGRYLLRKKEIPADLRGQSGLELDIYDCYTSKLRTVKTLSGGESFKASLALALGLSDVIQNNTGGVQIDTLFIDEGFGSLDSDSIEQAIKMLLQLTEGNRLVGIISHVAELKESIDKKIVVTNKKDGSSFNGSSLEVF